MTNIELFEYSKKHLEDKFDNFYVKNIVVIPEDSKRTNDLIKNNNELIELISAFNVLLKMGDKANDKNVEQIIERVIDILDNTKIKRGVAHYFLHNENKKGRGSLFFT